MTSPRFTRAWWREALPVPTVRLAAVIAVGGVCSLLLPGASAALVVVALTAIAVSVDLFRLVPPDRVEVTRRAPGTVILRGRAELEWTVRNHGSRSAMVHVADELAPSLRAGRRRVSMRVEPGGRATASTHLQPVRRGDFEPRRLELRVEGPWGLVARQTRLHVPDTIRVVPSFRSRREAELRIRRGRVLDVGLRSVRGHRGGTEFESLREYTIDDEFRRIDWAATARRGDTIVRTYRAEQNQRVVLLLDVGRVMAGVVEGVPRLDHAMDAALAVTTVCDALGDRVGLVAFGAAVRRVLAPKRTARAVGRITDGMYDLEPELAESAYEAAVVETLTRFRRRSLLIVLTDIGSGAVEDTLLPALAVARGRHAVTVAGVRDPALQRWHDAVPVDAQDAYRAAAAAEALRRREAVAHRLASLGAAVVDEEPARLAGRVIDVYLDLKVARRI